jgi:hypothetical protein
VERDCGLNEEMPSVCLINAGQASSARTRLDASGDELSGGSFINTSAPPATICRARRKATGNVLPLVSARRRIPAQARALKKYRCGTLPESSSASDNEDTLPSLGQSEVLSVQHSVGEPVPELSQPSEEGSQCPSLVRLQDTRDVLPNHPAGPRSVNKAKKLERQRATLTSQARSKSGDAEVLAWSSANKKIDPCALLARDLREVAMVGNLGVVVSQHARWERGDLGEERGLPSEAVPGDRLRFDA